MIEGYIYCPNCLCVEAGKTTQQAQRDAEVKRRSKRKEAAIGFQLIFVNNLPTIPNLTDVSYSSLKEDSWKSWCYLYKEYKRRSELFIFRSRSKQFSVRNCSLVPTFTATKASWTIPTVTSWTIPTTTWTTSDSLIGDSYMDDEDLGNADCEWSSIGERKKLCHWNTLF